MTVIVTANETIEIDDIVAEAVIILGYFRADAISFVAERFARQWGDTPYMFQNDGGDRIAPLPGRPHEYVAVDVWNMLSAKGRADPTHACKATHLRIRFDINRAFQARRERLWRRYHTKAEFRGVSDYACPAARAQAGRVISLNKRVLGLFERPAPLPKLPLSGCNAEWCACRWDGVRQEEDDD